MLTVWIPAFVEMTRYVCIYEKKIHDRELSWNFSRSRSYPGEKIEEFWQIMNLEGLGSFKLLEFETACFFIKFRLFS